MRMLLHDLAARADVLPPDSETSPGGVFLRAIEAATATALSGLDGDAIIYADVWPAVDAAIGDRDSAHAHAAAADLGLWADHTDDALARAAWHLSSSIKSATWAA